jgi:hypothetical protein
MDQTVDHEQLWTELLKLREEHADLDAAVEALERARFSDRLQVQRLKKRKLQVKDRIRHLEDILIPDISA